MNYSYGLQGYNSYTTPALYPTIHTTRSGTMAFHSHTSPYPNVTIPRKVNTPASTDTFVQQNAQLRQSIISTAQELGFTDPKELQTLNNRLQNAQIEVNNQDPTKTLNVRQKAQSDVKAQNKILSLALQELQESSSTQSKKLKVATLISQGEVPDEIAPNTFITHDAVTKSTDGNGTGVFDVKRVETKVTTDSTGKLVAHRTTTMVPVEQVDSLSTQFQIIDAEKAHYTGLSSDSADADALAKTLQTPEQQRNIQQLASSLGNIRANKNYGLLQQLVTPLENAIATTYGLQGQSVAFEMQSPDNGATFALFDPASQQVKIIAPAIEGLFKVGEKSGLSGDALNQYVATELVGTLTHETRHAYQFQVAKLYQQTLDANNPTQRATAQKALQAKGIDLTKDKSSLAALATNWQVYVAPNISKLLNGSLEDYKNQALEAGVELFEEQGKRIAKQAFPAVNNSAIS
jgi:hypothetical protein